MTVRIDLRSCIWLLEGPLLSWVIAEEEPASAAEQTDSSREYEDENFGSEDERD